MSNDDAKIRFRLQGENGNLHLAPEDTCFPLDGDYQQSLMGLRLWITRRIVHHPYPPNQRQVINYVDFLPNYENDDKNQRFRKLDQVIERINFEFQNGVHPKIGSIITIETLYHPVTTDWKIDSKNSLNNFPSRCVSIIRIFYSRKPPGVKFNSPLYKLPMIGINDFVPKQMSSGGFFKSPVFENFSQVLTRATDWITQNPELEFKNAQCLEVKMKTMGRIDTKIMSHNGDRGDYIRIYRVAYTKSTGQLNAPRSLVPSTSQPTHVDTSQVDVRIADTHEQRRSSESVNGGVAEEEEKQDEHDSTSREPVVNGEKEKVEEEGEEEEEEKTGEDEGSQKNDPQEARENESHEDVSNKSIKIKFERINTDGSGEVIEPEVEVTVEEPPRYENISSTPLISNPPPAPIFLSSVIFTPADQDATVYEIKRKMHEWIDQAARFAFRDGPIISRPRLLSAETVEFFCKDFSECEIKLETENTFKPNRIGTMNQFLFMAFRVYFDVGYFADRMESRRVSSTVVIPGSARHRSLSSSCSTSCTIA